MPKLKDINGWALGLDLRIDPVVAMDLRQGLGDLASWSLWPDAPFGQSADAEIWPSAFAPSDRAEPDRIHIEAHEAPYWQAMGLWDDMAELAAHIIPLPIGTELIAIALPHAEGEGRVRHDYAIEQMLYTGVSEEALGAEATVLGYDICEEFSTALFKSPPPEGFLPGSVPRAASGLIATYEAADALRPMLEAADPGAAPLLILEVWSLGFRPPS